MQVFIFRNLWKNPFTRKLLASLLQKDFETVVVHMVNFFINRLSFKNIDERQNDIP